MDNATHLHLAPFYDMPVWCPCLSNVDCLTFIFSFFFFSFFFSPNPMLSGQNVGLQARIQVEAKQPVGRSADRSSKVGDHAVVEVWTKERSSTYHTTTGEAIPGAPCNRQVVYAPPCMTHRPPRPWHDLSPPFLRGGGVLHFLHRLLPAPRNLRFSATVFA